MQGSSSSAPSPSGNSNTSEEDNQRRQTLAKLLSSHWSGRKSTIESTHIHYAPAKECPHRLPVSEVKILKQQKMQERLLPLNRVRKELLVPFLGSEDQLGSI